MTPVKLFSVLLICATFIFVCEAQLTFTTGWGKRSTAQPGLDLSNLFGAQDGCKSPVDSLMVIYRMIQSEAQKILECNQK
ncbi:hypertrehalosaemic prohormone-like [Topomyia yanbarensis]|uniref:hypertrehalosaemic prohormone-like n=1 Tax=Topomyia yanbarensis TaxID=2498891 RepID=UPI00273AC430|nr:hypertrehalosaemic prohormone-like [Topomyia yanbarensis]